MKLFLKKVVTVLMLFAPVLCWGADSLLINGAGATFPYPLYSKWFYQYQKTHPSLKFNYQSIGSGGGVRQILAGTVDFGASDAPMTDEDLAKAKGKKILHIPTVLGAVVVTYNALGIGSDLRLSGEIVAEIFLGKITKWNDPKIAALNPGKKLPTSHIIVTRRSDGSGTTHVFTEYLSKVSSAWKAKVGTGKAVRWPVGIGAKGNEGVTGMVQQTPGSIGYVELSYAIKNKLPTAMILNKSENFVTPSIASISAAAAGVKMPSDYRVSLTNSEGKNAYPISAFTYLLIPDEQQHAAKGKALVDFLEWAIHDGQKLAPLLHYAPLPREVVEKLETTIKGIKLPKE